MEIESRGIRVALTGASWRKSTRSGPNCDNCVEVAFVGGAVAVRDSKDQSGPAVGFTRTQWNAFLGSTRNGKFDLV